MTVVSLAATAPQPPEHTESSPPHTLQRPDPWEQPELLLGVGRRAASSFCSLPRLLCTGHYFCFT